MSNTLLNLQLTMITYMVIGYVACKARLATTETQKSISALVVELLLPVNVFVSSLESLSVELICSFMGTFVLAVSIEMMLLVLTRRSLKGFTHDEHCVVRYGLLVSNGGLIGAPVMEELLGTVGAVMCHVFMIPTRIVTYSAGELIFGRKEKQSAIKMLLKNKVLLAMGLALGMQTLHIDVPGPCLAALKHIGSCLSPLAILLIGGMLANSERPKKEMLHKIIWVTFLRLILIPLAALAFCRFCSIDFTNTMVLVLLLGMPTGTTIAIHAKKYQGDSSFAAAIVLVTTLCSTATLILLMKMIELIT